MHALETTSASPPPPPSVALWHVPALIVRNAPVGLERAVLSLERQFGACGLGRGVGTLVGGV